VSVFLLARRTISRILCVEMAGTHNGDAMMRGYIAKILPGNARMVRLAASAPGAPTTAGDEDGAQVTTVFGERGLAKTAQDAQPVKEAKAAPKRKGRKSARA